MLRFCLKRNYLSRTSYSNYYSRKSFSNLHFGAPKDPFIDNQSDVLFDISLFNQFKTKDEHFSQFEKESSVDVGSLIRGFELIKRNKVIPIVLKDSIVIINNKLKSLNMLNYTEKHNQFINDYEYAFNFLNSCIKTTRFYAAYIDVCIQNKNISDIRKRINDIFSENFTPDCIYNKTVIVEPIFYEPIIKYYAQKKVNIDEIKLILDTMKESLITPNPSIIINSLISFGYTNKMESENYIKELLNHLKNQNITIENAILQTSIPKDLYKYLLIAINKIKPNFSIQPKNHIKSKNPDNLINTPFSSTQSELKELFEKQLEKERDLKLYEHVTRLKTFKKTNLVQLKSLIKQWRNDLKVEYKNMLNDEKDKLIYPFLNILPMNNYVNVMINSLFVLVLNGFEYNSDQILKCYLGNEILMKYQYNYLDQTGYFEYLKRLFGTYFDLINNQPTNSNFTELWKESIKINLKNFGTKVETDSIVLWNEDVIYKVGGFLYNIMKNTLKDENGELILNGKFSEGFDNITVSPTIDIKILKLIKLHNKYGIYIPPDRLPMFHPPVPIFNMEPNSTTYFYVRGETSRMIRTVSKYQYDDDIIQNNSNNDDIFNSIIALNQIAWKIDKTNLDMIKELFVQGGNKDLKIPLNDYVLKKSFDEIITDKHFDKLLKTKSRKEMFSLWMTLLYRLDIAEHYREQKIWFPYFMDFRGRVYPCSPNFNHIGDDVSRSMLKFARGKELGPNGFNWLKIHLINLYGSHKKESNQIRLEAANNSLEDIIDSAKNPLSGRQWWKDSEKPWQTLMICREIVNILEYGEKNNGKIDNFISHVSVQQDGSCNGLQHYAALSRDDNGAIAVNMTNTEKPQDVYSDVLYFVLEKLKLDQEEGVPEAIHLKDCVNRKVIKQSIMTTVYGVTLYGAKLQIRKQLKLNPAISDEMLNKCSIYLARITMSSIGQVLQSATKIKKWLIQCSKEISKHHSSIQWITPLGFKVTHPYYKSENIGIKPDPKKNSNAFPPNFIHSLDSTHMMMTAMRCWQEDVTFVSVHDCFWTHACNVDRMNQICREEFVKLHSQPILENLSQHLLDTFGFDENLILNEAQKKLNKTLRNIPERGTFNLEDVLNSTYFFS